MDRRHVLKLIAASSAAGSAQSGMFAMAGSLSDRDLTVDYSQRDHEIIDYQFYELEDLPGIKLRGPRFDPRAQRNFFTCIGAAQTLGVYVEPPFPRLLENQVGLPAWNLGIGGANPRFFLQHRRLIELANRGRFVVLQIMAARSEPNDRFAATAGVEWVHDRKHDDIVMTNTAWDRVKSEEPERLLQYIAQSRAAWAAHYQELLAEIKVPVILFWFAPKDMDQPIDLGSSSGFGLVDRFPQFIDGSDVDKIKGLVQELVICRSDRNAGHPLISRFTGKPVQVQSMKVESKYYKSKDKTHNLYYPSVEMHEDAAEALKASIERLIQG